MSGQYSLSQVDLVVSLPGYGTITATGYESGGADDLINFAYNSELISVNVGDTGSVEHSTIQDRSGTCTLRLQQTSTLNARLMNFANSQNSDFSKLKNITIVILDRGATGGRELVTMTGCSISKFPDRSFVQNATALAWEFKASRIIQKMGA